MLLEGALFQKVALMFQRVQIISKCGQVQRGQPVARPRSNPVWIDIKNDLMNELIFEVENKKTVGIL